ncbi:MAG TPA: anti-sigma factor [Methylomirabilota bacterium]|nr:anti-sigma factor [Methylomirabilota bacterium]
MKSPHVEELLIAHARGELEEAERAQVEGHLDGCAQCRETLAAYRELMETLGRSAPPAPPVHWGAYRAELREKLERRVAGGSAAWWGLWRPAPALLAAGLLAALVYMGLPGGSRGPLGGDQLAFESAVLATRLDVIASLDVMQRLDVLEDFDVINRLDRLSTSEG